MTATLTQTAQRGFTEPKPRKARRASAFIVVMEAKLAALDDTTPKNGVGYALMSEASSVKDARAKGVDLPDGEYEIYCRRGKFTVSTPPAKKVVTASK